MSGCLLASQVVTYDKKEWVLLFQLYKGHELKKGHLVRRILARLIEDKNATRKHNRFHLETKDVDRKDKVERAVAPAVEEEEDEEGAGKKDAEKKNTKTPAEKTADSDIEPLLMRTVFDSIFSSAQAQLRHWMLRFRNFHRRHYCLHERVVVLRYSRLNLFAAF